MEFVSIAAAFMALALLWLWWRRNARRSRRLGVPAGVERRYTRHLRERMAERGVTERAIEQTLRAPHRRTHDSVERSYRFERDFPDETVKVWVAAEPWPPRHEVVVKSTAARRQATLTIRKEQVGRLIGRGGATVRAIRSESGASLDIEKSGRVRITADSRAQVDHALRLVRTAVSGRR